MPGSMLFLEGSIQTTQMFLQVLQAEEAFEHDAAFTLEDIFMYVHHLLYSCT